MFEIAYNSKKKICLKLILEALESDFERHLPSVIRVFMFFRNNLKHALTNNHNHSWWYIYIYPIITFYFSGIKPHINTDYTPKHKDHGKFLALIQTKKKNAPKNPDPACVIGPAADRRQQRSNKLVAVYQMGRGWTINLAPINVDLSSLLIVWKVDAESNSNFAAGPGQCLFPMEQLVSSYSTVLLN